MAGPIVKLERRARYAICLVALLVALAALAVKWGFIGPVPDYKTQAWYAHNVHSGFVVISEYGSEAECRSKAASLSDCRSGKTIMDQQRQADSQLPSSPEAKNRT